MGSLTKRIIPTLAASLLLALAGPAKAEPPPLLVPASTPVTPGGFYATVGGYAAVHKSGGFEYGTLQNVFDINGPTRPMFKEGESILVGGANLTFGYALKPDDWLGHIGAAPRIEVGLSFFAGTSRNSSSAGSCNISALSCDIATIGRLGGLNLANQGFLALPPPFVAVGPPDAGFFLRSRYRGELFGGDAVLRFRTDYTVSGTVVVSPAIGLLGGYQRTKHHLDIFYDVTGVPNLWSAEVSTKLSSFHIGPEGGLTAAWQATSSISLHGGLTVAVLYRHASLTGNDCGTQIGFPCPIINEPLGFFESEVDSSRSRIAVRLGLSAGATVQVHTGMTLTIMGFGSWDSAVPSIGRNDTRLTSAGFETSGPAHIRFKGNWTYGGALMLTFLFNS